MPTPRTLLPSLAALLVAVALLSGAAPAGAKSISCPAHTGTLFTAHGGRIYHQGTSLFSCVRKSSHRLLTRRLGPWSTGSKASFDGLNVAWTVQRTNGVDTFDRVYASNIFTTSRWLSGTPVIPNAAGESFSDGRIQRMLVVGEAAGWVTTTGQVVMAVGSPDGDGFALGALPAPLAVTKQLMLVGTFTDEPASTLANSMQLRFDDGASEGDDCGGTDAFDLTVDPSAASPRIGARWYSSWADDTGECA